jgi:predicted ribosome quality control (RQC) complex YloA/Tae2 family protein
MTSLNYEDLYGLAEELAKLIGSRLQSVLSISPERFELHFFYQSTLRAMVLDLSPAKPFVVSTLLTGSKKAKKKTPIYNFLNAHFISSFLEKLEIAEKPNRTLKLTFKRNEAERLILSFKCFPHGHELKLKAYGKEVLAPWRPTVKRSLDETVTYVEPAAVEGWVKNELLSELIFKDAKNIGAGSEKKAAEPYFVKLQKKLERAIQNIDATFDEQKIKDSERMIALEALAIEMQQQPNVDGDVLDKIYEEVRKLRKKSEVTVARREDLTKQLEFLKSPDGQAKFQKSKREAVDKPLEKTFSGTQVRLDARFELWVGRTAWQNDDLVRLASPHELWIHLRDYPGAHGLIRGPKKAEVPQSLVEFSCRVVGVLSQSKKNPFQEGQYLDFIVTPRKFIKKPKNAAPGLVTVERETVRRIAFKNVKFDVT